MLRVLNSRRFVAYYLRGFVGDADAPYLPLAAIELRNEKRISLTVSKGYMAKNAGSGAGVPPPDESPSGKSVVDLADARVRLNSRARPSQQNLLAELDEVRTLLD